MKRLAAAMLCALPVAAYCAPCRADSTVALHASAPQAVPTTVTLQPTQRPGAVAEVVLHNENINGHLDEIATELTHGAITIGVRFDWEADPMSGADAVVVTPPEGLICLPTDCRLVVEESRTGTLWLFSTEDVGM